MLVQQLDFILCFYGLAFILMSATAFACLRAEEESGSGQRRICWEWLAAFGAFHGIHEWVEMTGPSLRQPAMIEWPAVILLAVSFVCLFEFGRRTSSGFSARPPGPWVTLAVLGASMLGVRYGAAGWSVLLRYLVALPGGLWAAWALMLHLRTGPSRVLHLRLLVGALALYALAVGLVVPAVAFAPASSMNQDVFLALTGVPIQLVRGVLACGIMLLLWRHYETVRLAPPASGRVGQAWSWWLPVGAVLLAGWMVTARAGDAARSEAQERLLEMVGMAAGMVNGEPVVALERGDAGHSGPEHGRLERHLAQVIRLNSQVQACYLVGKRSGRLEILAYRSRVIHSDTDAGVLVAGAPDAAVLDVLATGEPVLAPASVQRPMALFSLGSPRSGPPADTRGERVLAACAPVRNDAGQTVGVLAIDVDPDWGSIEVARSRLAPAAVTVLISALVLLFGLVQVWERGNRQALERLSSHQARILQSLQYSEGRLRALTETAQDAIVMMGPDGEISFWNPGAMRMFGYTSEEALGQDLHRLLAPPRLREIFERRFASFQANGTGRALNAVVEMVALRKGGEEFPVELSLAAVLLDGRWHAVAIVRDISTRARDQEELQGAKAAVEATNVQLEQAVRHAEEMAEQARSASLAKSEFLANMSHEIRTPMNAVLGMTALLIDSGLPDEQKHYAEVVRSSGESLLTLIDDILDFSKIEAGRLNLESVDFELREILAHTGAALGVRATEKGLTVIRRVADDVPTRLRGDPLRLRQVLTNLLGNAIKFTSQGTITIDVAVASTEDGRVGLRFALSDTGIGIAPDRVAVLFSPFIQADGSITRRFGGTGLGLSICRRLVQMMGGSIGVESAEGRGSTFWFTAFFDSSTLDDGALESPPPTREEIVPILPGTWSPREEWRYRRVLVAEDNLTNQEVISGILGRLGLACDIAVDGSEVLRFLEEIRYDLVLMDCQMPVMDGFEATRRIRSSTSAMHDPGIPIVALTAHAMESDRAACLAAGMNDYLAKPIQLGALIEALDRWLPSSGGAPAQPASPAAEPEPEEPDESVFDAQTFVNRVLGSRTLAVKVALCFLDDFPGCVTRLDEALAKGDAEEVTRMAHQIKGSAASVGGAVLSRRAAEMQHLAAKGNLDAVARLRPDLGREGDRLVRALNAFVEDLSTTPGQAMA